MKSKEWINQMKVINNYLPSMKQGQQEFSDQELIQNIIWNTVPEACERDFEVLDRSRATTMQQVRTILQKVEQCKAVEKRNTK